MAVTGVEMITPHGTGTPQPRDADEAIALQIQNQGMLSSPQFPPGAAKVIDEYIRKFYWEQYNTTSLVALEEYKWARWYLGRQYVTIEGGRLTEAPRRPGVVRQVDNWTANCVDTMASILTRGDPRWETGAAWSGVPDTTKQLYNNILNTAWREAGGRLTWTNAVTNTMINGVRFVYPRWRSDIGDLIAQGAKPNGQPFRRGAYTLEQIGISDLFFDRYVKDINDSPIAIRLVRLNVEQAKALYGQGLSTAATNVPTADGLGYRMPETLSQRLFYNTFGQISSQFVQMLDCWLRPELLRSLVGSYPGIENGLRRIMLAVPSRWDASNAWQRPEFYGSEEEARMGVLASSYWPEACRQTGKYPFFPMYFRRAPEIVAGLGIPELVEHQQIHLNLLASGMANTGVLENINIRLVPREDEGNARNWNVRSFTDWVYQSADKKPEFLKMPTTPADIKDRIEFLKREIENLALLMPSDFGRTPADARAVNATTLAFETEQARSTKAPIVDSVTQCLEQVGQYIARDAPYRYDDNFVQMHAEDSADAMARWVDDRNRGVCPVTVHVSDSNNDLPYFERQEVARAAPFLPSEDVRKALVGPMRGITGGSVERSREHAQRLVRALRNFTELSPDGRAAYMPPQPHYVVNPATGVPLEELNSQTGMIEPVYDGMQVTLTDPDVTGGMEPLVFFPAPQPAYYPEYFLSLDPYKEAAGALMSAPEFGTWTPDQQEAVKWFAEQVFGRDAIWQQSVATMQQDLRKQGISDKPMMDDLAAKGEA